MQFADNGDNRKLYDDEEEKERLGLREDQIIFCNGPVRTIKKEQEGFLATTYHPLAELCT